MATWVTIRMTTYKITFLSVVKVANENNVKLIHSSKGAINSITHRPSQPCKVQRDCTGQGQRREMNSLEREPFFIIRKTDPEMPN